ncbi:MAG: hypothetical protein IJS63_05350 [Bacteroidaceae bacterium]|nr:hypothetical protein [Bacteroidaceae bacterium]
MDSSIQLGAVFFRQCAFTLQEVLYLKLYITCISTSCILHFCISRFATEPLFNILLCFLYPTFLQNYVRTGTEFTDITSSTGEALGQLEAFQNALPVRQ